MSPGRWLSPLECCLTPQKAEGSIPSQGAHGRRCLSLTLMFLSLVSINVSSGEDPFKEQGQVTVMGQAGVLLWHTVADTARGYFSLRLHVRHELAGGSAPRHRGLPLGPR